VGKAGQTLSATDFAELTGVSRERLRTWERRHGFPEPVRSHGGRRRYAVDDVARVVAVRRAVEAGTPVTAAVAAAGPPPDDGVSAGTRSALAEHAPVAVVVLSGPEPLRVEWVNALVRHRPGAPAAGDELSSWRPGSPTTRAPPSCASCSRATGSPPPARTRTGRRGLRPGGQSLAYRLPQEDGRRPLVALIGIDTGRERRTRHLLAEADAERELLRAQVDDEARAAETLAAVSDLCRLESGGPALSDATGVLVRRLGAVDAGIAPYMAGALVLGRSARGLLGPDMVTVSRFDELADGMRDGEATWLRGPTAEAFGAPRGLAVLALPMLAAGRASGRCCSSSTSARSSARPARACFGRSPRSSPSPSCASAWPATSSTRPRRRERQETNAAVPPPPVDDGPCG
jgi:hypothetical protein